MSLWGGFDLWVPPTSPDNNGVPVFEIIGTDAQIVQFPLQPGQAITCEVGTMCYMSSGVKLEIKTGGLMSMMGAAAGGESIIKCLYTNRSNEIGYVALTSDIPGVIMPVDMSEFNVLKCKRGAWFGSTGDNLTRVTADFNRANSAAGCLCGGMDLVVQALSGGQGFSFLSAFGTIICRTLERGEEIIVDTNSILAFTEQVQLDVRRVGGIGAMCCAGEGAFNTVLTGPGKVYLESMPIEKLRALFPEASNGGGGGAGAGAGGGGGCG